MFKDEERLSHASVFPWMIDNNNQITTVLVSHELQTMPKLTFPGGSVRKRRGTIQWITQ